MCHPPKGGWDWTACPFQMETKVSVVIPTFQRAALLLGVVRDVLSQPLQEIEVIVVDDGSTDDTGSQIALIRDERLSYVNQGKLGVPAVLNEGIARSKAPYIQILHDHDRIEPSLLTELAAALDRNPSAGFAFSGYVFYDANLENEQERWLLELPELNEGQKFLEEVLMPRINSPVLALSMIRRSALQGELLDPTIGGCADVELWHRLAARSDVAYVRKPLIHVRGRDPRSQFSSPGSALDLMGKTLEAKRRFLGNHPQLATSWARQVDAGCIYVAWKAVEAGDRATLRQAGEFVAENGSALGTKLFRLVTALPHPLGKSVLRGVRSIHRRVRKNTL